MRIVVLSEHRESKDLSVPPSPPRPRPPHLPRLRLLPFTLSPAGPAPHPLSLTVPFLRCRVRPLGPFPALPDRRRNVCLSAEPSGPLLSSCAWQRLSLSKRRETISMFSSSK